MRKTITMILICTLALAQGPSGGQGETNPSGSQSGTGGGEAVSPPVSEPSQDVPAGDGLTVTDLPDWLNPTGMETAA